MIAFTIMIVGMCNLDHFYVHLSTGRCDQELPFEICLYETLIGIGSILNLDPIILVMESLAFYSIQFLLHKLCVASGQISFHMNSATVLPFLSSSDNLCQMFPVDCFK